jgi:hypothetical protein
MLNTKGIRSIDTKPACRSKQELENTKSTGCSPSTGLFAPEPDTAPDNTVNWQLCAVVRALEANEPMATETELLANGLDVVLDMAKIYPE